MIIRRDLTTSDRKQLSDVGRLADQTCGSVASSKQVVKDMMNNIHEYYNFPNETINKWTMEKMKNTIAPLLGASKNIELTDLAAKILSLPDRPKKTDEDDIPPIITGELKIDE